MSGVSKFRPSMADLKTDIEIGMSRTDVADKHGVHIDTVSGWCNFYNIAGMFGSQTKSAVFKPQNIDCGLATVVGMVVKNGEPERYPIPGCDVVTGRDAARKVAARMDDVMAGRSI